MTSASDLLSRLEKAVSDEEARLPLSEAFRLALSPDMPDYLRASDLLSGDPAGWIGIGVLMMPKGFLWRVVNGASGIEATVQSPPGTAATPAWRHEEAIAQRPDCALVLATLNAGG